MSALHSLKISLHSAGGEWGVGVGVGVEWGGGGDSQLHVTMLARQK